MVRPDGRASARKSFVFLVMGMAISLFASVSYGDVPHMISYQGKLTTASGGCLNDTVQMTFSIYSDDDVPHGTAPDWTETQNSVIVKEGIFNVLLGAVDTIPQAVFDGNTKYLGVQVESDMEMRPLKPMVSVAYAYRARTADGVGSLPAPIIWSGGCTSHGQGSGWITYCTDGVDFNTASGYLSTDGSGVFTVATAGFYRINAWVLFNTSSDHFVKVLKNGGQIYNSMDYSGDGYFHNSRVDLTWFFDIGDQFEVRYSNQSGSGYAFHSWSSSGQFSRLQITYVGPAAP